MAKRENFTADRVAKFQCEPGKQQTIYWDGKDPGLGLRMTATGAKSYIFEAWMHGKSLRITIGNVLTWIVVKAQARATELKALTDQGIDPRQQAAEKLATVDATRADAKRKVLLFLDAWAAYIADRCHKWSPRHLADHETLTYRGGDKRKRGDGLRQPGPLAALMDCKLPEVDTDRVKAWLKIEAERRPTQARLAYNRLRAFLNWCERRITQDQGKCGGMGGVPDRHICANHGPQAKRNGREALPRKAT
jgi:hypothetical protein